MKAKYRGCAFCTHRPTLYKSQFKEWIQPKTDLKKPYFPLLKMNHIWFKSDLRKIYVLNLKTRGWKMILCRDENLQFEIFLKSRFHCTWTQTAKIWVVSSFLNGVQFIVLVTRLFNIKSSKTPKKKNLITWNYPSKSPSVTSK